MLQYLSQELKKHFPSLADQILKSGDEPIPISIKINPYKTLNIQNLDFDQKVPWANYGYYLKNKPFFVEDPLWHAGTYYVQEASSMFLDFMIQKILENTPPIQWKILDLCAAPGGKTLSLAANFPLDSFILANEIDPQRLSSLQYNLTIAGYPNLYISHNKPEDFPHEPFFHCIIIDAPCSGEGMFRKHPTQLTHNLNNNYVYTCAQRQKNILQHAQKCLLPGGYLIYSTCTFNLEENEKLITNFLSENPDFETLFFEVPQEWNIFINQYQKVKFYRFFPGITKGEGFSLTLLRKKGDLSLNTTSLPLKKDKHKTHSWIENHLIHSEEFSFFSKNQKYFAVIKKHFQDWEYLQTELKLIKNGIFIGTQKGNDFIPEHEWALSLVANTSLYPQCELDLPNALCFLQKQTFSATPEKSGIHLINYKGITIGLAKNLGNRWNNLLPHNFKIRKSIDT